MGQYADLFDAPPKEPSPAPLAVGMSATASPDQAAKAVKIARRYGLPPAVAEAFQEDYASRAKSEDAQKLFDTKAPRLGSWIAEQPDRAKLVHDDLENFGNIEQSIGTIVSYVMGARPGHTLGKDVGNALDVFARGGLSNVIQGYTGLTRAFYDAIGADEIAKGQGAIAARAGALNQEISADLADQSTEMGRGIAGGLSSAGQNAYLMPFAFGKSAYAGSELVLRSMAALAGGQSYNKARDAGAGVVPSMSLAVADTASEYIGEKFFGMGGLLKDAKAGTGLVKMFVRDVAREIPGELGTTLSQNFNEWAIINPDRPLGDWWDEQPAALRETFISTIVAAGAQSGAMRAAQKVTGDIAMRQQAAQQAEQSGAALERLAQFAAASKTLSRDSQTVREFVAQVADEDGDGATELFIDGEQLQNVLNQSGMSREEFAAVAPKAAEQLDAAAHGGLVTLPMSEFVVLGDKAAPLIDHIRVGEDMPSRAEAREYMASDEAQQLQGQVEAEFQRRGGQDADREATAGLAQRFEKELLDAGRAPMVAKSDAQVRAGGYATLANRAGMPLDEFLREYKLDVVNTELQGDSMTQADTATPEFQNWFKESKVVDDTGKPLVVYHGTRADFSEFDQAKVGGRFSVSAGFYLTSRPETASLYADGLNNAATKWNPKDKFTRPLEDGANVMPAYVALKNPLELTTQDFSAERMLDADGGAIVRKARADGYDGIIVRRNKGDEFDGMTVVAFRPEQIKSAIGNNGNFDPSDPNILNQGAATEADLVALRKRESVLKSLLNCL